MQMLGQALYRGDQSKDALTVFEAQLDWERRLPSYDSDDDDTLTLQGNIADCYYDLKRYGDAITLRRAVYNKRLAKHGPMDALVIGDALSIALSLVEDYFFEEAKTLLRDLIPKAESVLGNQHQNTLVVRELYAKALYKHCDANLAEVREAIATLKDVHRMTRQVFGSSHPNYRGVVHHLAEARERLSLQEAYEARLVEDASEKLAQGLRIDGDESEAP